MLPDQFVYPARGYLTVNEVLDHVGMAWRTTDQKTLTAVDDAINGTRLYSAVSLAGNDARSALLGTICRKVWPEYAPLLEAIADAVKSEKPGQT